ncbi:hypothetical protein [Leptolyngbya sp. CCY15150]|uniref:hypothetical protein n=1 Tax=Leptolyngbya sp. CCY15150 TaxID=2767772 RepID=UPI00194E9D92|nr:hypothetical protein [Leptolyngbya sp. CCY15150]
MQVTKLSISLSQSLLAFVEDYQHNHAFSSHSQVIEKALELLREQELKATHIQVDDTTQPQNVAIGCEPTIPTQAQETILQRMGGMPKHLLSTGGLSDRETRQALIAERIQARYQARS